MTDPQHVSGEQRAIVDQSIEERDPADDSDEINDPAAIVETYPKAFDDKIAAADAIKTEAASDTDLTDDASTGLGTYRT